jgi:hypothetical protein
MSDNILIDISTTLENVNVEVVEASAQSIGLEYFYPQGPQGLQGPAGVNTWGSLSGTLSAQSDLWRYLSAETFSPSQLTAYLASNSITLCSIDVRGQLLSAGTDLFDIFLTSETDSQTLSFNETSKDLSISSGNTVSLSSFTANTDFNSYKTNVASATATLLPTTIYQEASGFWQAASTVTSQSSANTILAGGNTRGAITTIGTNDAFNLRLETNNTTRINILSSGFVGIGTANNDSRVTERLTVDGNINLRETGTATRYLEIGTGRTGNGNSYIDLIGDATHLDFATRIIRDDTGPNANSNILHRGTGDLILNAMDAGDLKFFTNNTERGTINSVGNFSFGNVIPNERLTVSGNISATGTIYDNAGNSIQWNEAYNIGTVFVTNSGKYESVYTTVQTNSGSWNKNYIYVSSNTNLSSNFKYAIDTTPGSLTAVLPPFPQTGDEIEIFDIAGTWNTNSLIVNNNGRYIEQLLEPLNCNVQYGLVKLIYTNSAFGWRIIPMSKHDVPAVVVPPTLSADPYSEYVTLLLHFNP